jgi:hypothetical protein
MTDFFVGSVIAIKCIDVDSFTLAAGIGSDDEIISFAGGNNNAIATMAEIKIFFMPSNYG